MDIWKRQDLCQQMRYLIIIFNRHLINNLKNDNKVLQKRMFVWEKDRFMSATALLNSLPINSNLTIAKKVLQKDKIIREKVGSMSAAALFHNSEAISS